MIIAGLIVLYLIAALITAAAAMGFDHWAHDMYVGDDVYIVLGLLWPLGMGVVAGNLLWYLLTGR